MASTDLPTLAEKIAQVGHPTSVAAHGQHWIDDCANAPSADAFLALLEAFRSTGGCSPAAMVNRLLAEHPVGDAVSVAKLILTRQLFGFEWRANLWIPMFQFRLDDLSLRAKPQQVRAVLPSEWSGWMLAAWFAGRNRRLSGSSPVDVLDIDFNAVVQAAMSCVATDAIEPRHPPDRADAWAHPTAWRERRAKARL
jgi:hypothetical protein